MRVAMFSAGTAGAGHFVRASAVHRALRRRKFDGAFRVFGPAWPFPVAQNVAWHRPIVVDQDRQGSAALAPRTDLSRALLEYRPELLIVDLHWAPIHHIASLFDCEIWLLLRKCPDIWFVGPPEAPFDAARWDRVIAMEPMVHESFTHRIDPIVVANPDECRPASALREHVGVPGGQTLAVVAHTGTDEQHAALHAVGDEGVSVVHFDLRDARALFPLAEWLLGADVIMTGAGYNTYWESKWLGYFDRCYFTPFPCAIDDQAWRMRECADYWPTANGADTLAEWILAG